MRRQVIIALAALVLVGCETTKQLSEAPPPIAEPCPAEGLAPIKASPVAPTVSQPEQDRLAQALVAILGAERAQALSRFWDVELPQWGGQGWERAARVKTWCDAR